MSHSQSDISESKILFLPDLGVAEDDSSLDLDCGGIPWKEIVNISVNSLDYLCGGVSVGCACAKGVWKIVCGVYVYVCEIKRQLESNEIQIKSCQLFNQCSNPMRWIMTITVPGKIDKIPEMPGPKLAALIFVGNKAHLDQRNDIF